MHDRYHSGSDRFDSFGLETPFASQPGEARTEPAAQAEKFEWPDWLFANGPDIPAAAAPSSGVTFPSGLVLKTTTGATGYREEHFDPNGIGLPLLDTGPTVHDQLISTSFKVKEFTLSGGKHAPVSRISPELVRVVQAIRDRAGKAVTITSGYRSYKRNLDVYAGINRERKAKGLPPKKPTNSRHSSGQGVDLKIAGLDGPQQARLALDAAGPDLGIGIGGTFIHVDVRGRFDVWNYGGAPAGSIEALRTYRSNMVSAAGAGNKESLDWLDTEEECLAAQDEWHESNTADESCPHCAAARSRGENWEFEDEWEDEKRSKVPALLAPPPGSRTFSWVDDAVLTGKCASTKVSAFVPAAAAGKSDVEVLLYVHGLLGPCQEPPVKDMPSLILSPQFKLAETVAASGRPMVLIVPQFQDGNNRSWDTRRLHCPGALNRFLKDALARIASEQQLSNLRLSNLIVAGHSKAYEILFPLIEAGAAPAMATEALAKLSEIWALDATYRSFPKASFEQLRKAKPRLTARIIYIKGSSDTDRFGGKASSGPLSLVPVRGRHCSIPAIALPKLLAGIEFDREAQFEAAGTRHGEAFDIEAEFEEEADFEEEGEFEDEDEDEDFAESWEADEALDFAAEDPVKPSAAKLARIARALAGKSSRGKCYRWVKRALQKSGMVDVYLPGVAAKGAGSELVKHGFFDILAAGTHAIKSPYDAPVGAVLVYDKTDAATDKNAKYGHIEIRTTDGFASDYFSKRARTGAAINGLSGRGRRLIGVYFKELVAADEYSGEWEGFESEDSAWTGSPEQIDFRSRVLQAHLKRSAKRMKPDLTEEQLTHIPGLKEKIQISKDAAPDAGQLFAAINRALERAKLANHEDAMKIGRVTAGNSYRSKATQHNLWLNAFIGYYNRTIADRSRIADGPHSEAALKYMFTPAEKGGFEIYWKIAAPGTSDHQSGTAIDFRLLKPSGKILLAGGTKPENRRRWKVSWFYKWMKENAVHFNFYPLKKEEWHWTHEPNRKFASEDEAWQQSEYVGFADTELENLSDEGLQTEGRWQVSDEPEWSQVEEEELAWEIESESVLDFEDEESNFESEYRSDTAGFQDVFRPDMFGDVDELAPQAEDLFDREGEYGASGTFEDREFYSPDHEEFSRSVAGPIDINGLSVIDERIDVSAQQALLRMARGTPSERSAAELLVAAVKGGDLLGIYGDDLAAAAALARRNGTQRWTLVPKGEDAVLVFDATQPADEQPTIVFRGDEGMQVQGGVRGNRLRLDPALRKAAESLMLWRIGRIRRCGVKPPTGDGWLAEATTPKILPIANITPSFCRVGFVNPEVPPLALRPALFPAYADPEKGHHGSGHIMLGKNAIDPDSVARPVTEQLRCVFKEFNIEVMNFDINTDRKPNWLAATYRKGITRFDTAMIFCHPAPPDTMTEATYTDRGGEWPKLFRYAEMIGSQLSFADANIIGIFPFFSPNSWKTGGIFAENWKTIVDDVLRRVKADALQKTTIDAPVLKNVILAGFSRGRALMLTLGSRAKGLTPFVREIWDFDGTGAPPPRSGGGVRAVLYDQAASSNHQNAFHVPGTRWICYHKRALNDVHNNIPDMMAWHAASISPLK